MNIIVFRHNGCYYFRPDNTFTKGESGIFYLPGTIPQIEIVPALIAKVDRAAKGLSRQFAHRYIAKYSYGLLIYPETKECSIRDTLRTTLDNTTYISDNFVPIESMLEDCDLTLTVDNQAYLYKVISSNIRESISLLAERVTLYSSLKTGDLLCLELKPQTIEAPILTGVGSSLSLSVGKDEILNIQIK